MGHKRILTVQDISCVGQCSLTVALPVLSVCGHETCVLPTEILSTHTGFRGPAVLHPGRETLERFWRHWQREGITFVMTNTLKEAEKPDEPEKPGEPEQEIPDQPTPGGPGEVPPGEPEAPMTLPDTPVPTGPALPQTGQLWWPVPLLICAGLLFVVIGLVRRRESGGEK